MKRVQLASALPFGSDEQVSLVSHRIMQGKCVECGRKKSGNYDFCDACLAGFPKRTNIRSPYDAWQYLILQTKPALPDFSAFSVWREGVFERSRSKTQFLACTETFKEAEAIAQKKLDRAYACAW